MSLRDLFVPERRSTLENPSYPLTSSALIDFTRGPTSDAGVHVTPERSLHMAAVWRAVNVLSGVLASTPLGIYAAGTLSEQTSNLLNNPHPDMTVFELWRWSYVSRLLWGNAYFQKVRTGAGQLSSLYPIAPSLVRVARVPMTAANPQGKLFQVTTDGVARPYTAYDIFHVPGFGYDGVCGVSPIRMATQAVGMGLAAEEYGARFFGNGSLMSGVLQTEQRLDQVQADALQSRWQAKVAGLRNSHQVAILDSGAKFTSMTVPNSDAQFLESRDFQVGEIERFFGVPPFLMFDTDKVSSWGCLPGDSLVFTTTGPKPIVDVKPGDEVWSFSDQGGMEPAKVTDWVMTGYKPLLTVKTTTRELRLTANHRVPVRRYFGGLGRGRCEWRTVEVSAGEIVPGDYLLVPHGLKGGDRTVAPNGRELTVKAMELCGLYLGDGSADKNRVEIAHAVDDPHMPYYRESIRAEFGVEPYTDKRGTRSRFSSAAARSLLECGFTGNAHTKRVPDWVFRLTTELQLAFVRGYLDADGGIARGVISFASCNRPMLEDVRHLCIQLGVPVGRVHLSRPAGLGVIRGKVCASTDKFVLNLSSVPFNAKIGSNHPSKVANLINVPTERTLRYDAGYLGKNGATTGRAPNAASAPAFGWEHPDVVLQKVQSVTAGTVAVPVYDITVGDLHHFVADGVVVHNTGLEQQSIGWVQYDLIPSWFSPTEQRITKELCVPGAYAKYKVQGLMRGDSVSRAAFYATMRNVGAFSANDIRELEDLPPVSGGATRLQPLNMAPLGAPPTVPVPAPAPASPTPDPGGTDASSAADN